MKPNAIIRHLITAAFLLTAVVGFGQKGFLTGSIQLEDTWQKTIYLSHIPTMEEMYVMSRDVIIASTDIDSTGSFAFDLSFLTESPNLFRLHLAKNGDSPTSLIIGGNDENHLFLVASRNSQIEMHSIRSVPPFRGVRFDNSPVNQQLQRVSTLVHDRTRLAAESDAAKRRFIENDLKAQLATIADSADNYMVGLYALYNREGEIDYSSDPGLFDSFNNKWIDEANPYLQAFRNKLPEQSVGYSPIWFLIAGLLLLVAGFLAGRKLSNRESGNPNISKLSIQERKIFNLLRQGASNQEISEECNIGVSTVKSHVSSIYSKLKVKSRKEVMNLPS